LPWPPLWLQSCQRRHLGTQAQRWQYYEELMKGYRAWLGDLPLDVPKKIGWSHGADLFGVK
jgi:hypothetical protein